MSILIDSSFGDDTPDLIIVLYSLKTNDKKGFNNLSLFFSTLKGACVNDYFSTLI